MSAPATEILSFGCRLNRVESEVIRGVAGPALGERVIVNTCAVTAEAGRQARQAIRRARRQRPGAEIIVTGCGAEVETALYRAMPEVDRIVGNAEKTDARHWRPPTGEGTAAAKPAFGPEGAAGLTRGFVAVQNGCDHACTFCIIPQGRGPSRSLAPEAVLAAVRDSLAAGCAEVVLTGVDITSYAAGGLRLGGLVRRILRAEPGLPRLRLSSIDCIEADGELFAAFAEEPRLMPHLHLSLQSGADLILKRMRRRHGRAEAIEVCTRLRRLRPDIAFGADVIAGFPTETEAEAEATVSLVEACDIAYLHVFPYSLRPGTPAARMPQVPAAVIAARAERLRALGAARLAAHLDAQVGRTLPVLTERGGRARAPDFSPVRIDGIPRGQLADARILAREDGQLRAVRT